MKYTLNLLTLIFLSSIGIVEAQAPLNPVFTQIGGNFSTPLGVRNAGDGSNRLFVIERSGRIMIIDSNDNALATPFLNITALVDTFFEGGLLGLAFHPDYLNNGYFYVNYTSEGLGGNDLLTNIARYQVSSGDDNVANAGSEEIILSIDQPAGNHNGGDIHFGADGFLYIGMGDGGAGSSTAQNMNSHLGKMLRIDPSDTASVVPPYTIPESNPFVGVAGLDEIWAVGLRNPYRFSFDRDTGDLFIADVGAGSREEVDFQAATSTGGENYGWNCREGSISGPGGCSVNGAIDPINEYTHAGGRCSITGGYRYRGVETSWQGTYLYADFCSGDIFFTQFLGNWTSSEILADAGTNVYGFGESEDGRLFYTTGSRVMEINDADFDDVIFINGFE